MRTPEEALAKVGRRLNGRWAGDVWAEVAAPVPDSWPFSVSLGRPTSADLGADFASFLRQVHYWREWATHRGVQLDEQSRRVAGSQQFIPSHVVISDLDEAAKLCGDPWPDLLSVARVRAQTIQEHHPEAVDPVSALRSAARLPAVDFDIARRVAAWFAGRPPTATAGTLTPRQVPIEGVHAKWLNNHQSLVCNLAGLDDLDLASGHPRRIHFTYLDPEHLNTGRRHDSYSIGDEQFDLPYAPQVVIISENKDTAVGFPTVPGGISIEGAGAGGGTIAATPWVRDAPCVIYWGDLDVDGLRILNEFRVAGVPARSILMDLDTYNAYARYGTDTDKNGQPITIRSGADPLELTRSERELYDYLAGPAPAVLRVEQERIPLEVALAHVKALCERTQT